MDTQHNQYIAAILTLASLGAVVYLAAVHSISGDLAVTVILSALGISGTVRGAQVGGQLALTAPGATTTADTVTAPEATPPATVARPPVGTTGP